MELDLPKDGDLQWGPKLRAALNTLAQIGTPEVLEAKGLPISSLTATSTVVVSGTSGLLTRLMLTDSVVKNIVNVSCSSILVSSEASTDEFYIAPMETGQFLVNGERVFRLDEINANDVELNAGLGIELALPNGSFRSLQFQEGLRAVVDDDGTIRVIFDLKSISETYIAELKMRLDKCQG